MNQRNILALGRYVSNVLQKILEGNWHFDLPLSNQDMALIEEAKNHTEPQSLINDILEPMVIAQKEAYKSIEEDLISIDWNVEDINNNMRTIRDIAGFSSKNFDQYDGELKKIFKDAQVHVKDAVSGKIGSSIIAGNFNLYCKTIDKAESLTEIGPHIFKKSQAYCNEKINSTAINAHKLLLKENPSLDEIKEIAKSFYLINSLVKVASVMDRNKVQRYFGIENKKIKKSHESLMMTRVRLSIKMAQDITLKFPDTNSSNKKFLNIGNNLVPMSWLLVENHERDEVYSIFTQTLRIIHQKVVENITSFRNEIENHNASSLEIKGVIDRLESFNQQYFSYIDDLALCQHALIPEEFSSKSLLENFQEIISLPKKRWQHSLEALDKLDILNVENNETFNAHLNNYLLLFKLAKYPFTYKAIGAELLFSEEKLINKAKKIYAYFCNREYKFDECIKNIDFSDMAEQIRYSSSSSKLLKIFIEFFHNHQTENQEILFIKDQLQATWGFDDKCNKLCAAVLGYKEKFNFKRFGNDCEISDKEIYHIDSHSRDSFFSELYKSYLALLICDSPEMQRIIDTRYYRVGESNNCLNNFINVLSSMGERLQKSIAKVFTEDDESYYSQWNIEFDIIRSCKENFDERSIQNLVSGIINKLVNDFEHHFKNNYSDKFHSLLLQDIVNAPAMFTDILVMLKVMAEKFVYFKYDEDGAKFEARAYINNQIDKILDKNRNLVPLLGNILMNYNKKNHQYYARLVIAQHKSLSGYADYMRNNKTKAVTLDVVLQNLISTSGSKVNREKLREAYDEFNKKYHSHVDEGLTKYIKDKKLADVLSLLAKNCKSYSSSQDSDRNKVINLLAYLFAYWTLLNSDYYRQIVYSNNNNIKDNSFKEYLRQPHPAQVISIFRLFGIDADEGVLEFLFKSLHSASKIFDTIIFRVTEFLGFKSIKKEGTLETIKELDYLHNHLVQIPTGEGKSIIMAMMSSVFALMGHTVHSVCYSKYLKDRDYKAFVNIFSAFGVKDMITYNTFPGLSENLLKRHLNMRSKVNSFIKNGKLSISQDSIGEDTVAPHLFIDEVDQFFSSSLYNDIYQLTEIFRHPAITALIKYIWTEWKYDVNKKLNFRLISTHENYLECRLLFPKFKNILEESVKSMLMALKTLDSHEYFINNNEIGYMEHDQIVCNQVYGYSTMFAYYKEFENDKITEEVLNEKLGLYINCGKFSFAELLKEYIHIKGVSGSLIGLNAMQTQDMSENYKLDTMTLTPSAYGDKNNRFIFDPAKHIKIVSNNEYYQEILAEIEIHNTRAVLVFFESIDELSSFFKSDVFQKYRPTASVLTEELDDATREVLISSTATLGKITLATYSFTRGVDFVCHDEVLNSAGGLHLITTIVPMTKADQTQFEGRTGRWGNNGSCSWVISEKELMAKYKFSKEIASEFKNALDKTNAYGELIKARDKIYDEEVKLKIERSKINKAIHDESVRGLQALRDGDEDKTIQYLLENNRAYGFQEVSHTVIMLDGTGSMRNLIDCTKNTITEMFSRAKIILSDHGYDPDLFFIRILVYRNYNVEEKDLLECSSSASSPEELRNFLSKIRAHGGFDDYGNEAIEVAIQRVNQWVQQIEGKNITSKEEPIYPNQIILIGDYPANTKEHTNARWESLKNKDNFTKTYYDDEVAKLISKDIPVHTCYLYAPAKDCFEKLAQDTKGKSQFLDVNKESAPDELMAIVTETILQNIGGKKLVDAYRHRYIEKGCIASSSTEHQPKQIHSSNAVTGDEITRGKSNKSNQETRDIEDRKKSEAFSTQQSTTTVASVLPAYRSLRNDSAVISESNAILSDTYSEDQNEVASEKLSIN